VLEYLYNGIRFVEVAGNGTGALKRERAGKNAETFKECSLSR
jgi:hypothetical protein